MSAQLNAQFNLSLNYCGNLDIATEKLNFVFQGGGQRHREFWIKSDKPELAKNFCDENLIELKKLLATDSVGMEKQKR